MNKKQREQLSKLMTICNDLGHTLDYTATNQKKLIERQQSIGLIGRFIFHFFGDHKNNDYREYDLEQAEILLEELDELTKKDYGDRYGIKSFGE